MRNAIVIVFSRGVLQPSGIRRFGNGVSQLSPLRLRPVLGNLAIHSSKSFEMSLLLSAFSNVLPLVICGQPIGRECDTQPVITAVAPGFFVGLATSHVSRLPTTTTTTTTTTNTTTYLPLLMYHGNFYWCQIRGASSPMHSESAFPTA